MSTTPSVGVPVCQSLTVSFHWFLKSVLLLSSRFSCGVWVPGCLSYPKVIYAGGFGSWFFPICLWVFVLVWCWLCLDESPNSGCAFMYCIFRSCIFRSSFIPPRVCTWRFQFSVKTCRFVPSCYRFRIFLPVPGCMCSFSVCSDSYGARSSLLPLFSPLNNKTREGHGIFLWCGKGPSHGLKPWEGLFLFFREGPQLKIWHRSEK